MDARRFHIRAGQTLDSVGEPLFGEGRQVVSGTVTMTTRRRSTRDVTTLQCVTSHIKTLRDLPPVLPSEITITPARAVFTLTTAGKLDTRD